MPLMQSIPMALEIDYGDLTNRVFIRLSPLTDGGRSHDNSLSKQAPVKVAGEHIAGIVSQRQWLINDLISFAGERPPVCTPVTYSSGR
jgi:hypothetical protein